MVQYQHRERVGDFMSHNGTEMADISPQTLDRLFLPRIISLRRSAVGWYEYVNEPAVGDRNLTIHKSQVLSRVLPSVRVARWGIKQSCISAHAGHFLLALGHNVHSKVMAQAFEDVECSRSVLVIE